MLPAMSGGGGGRWKSAKDDEVHKVSRQVYRTAEILLFRPVPPTRAATSVVSGSDAVMNERNRTLNLSLYRFFEMNTAGDAIISRLS